MFKRLLRWIWPRRTPVLIPVFGDVFGMIDDLLARHRPELRAEWDALGNGSPAHAADWLDENFPLAGASWGVQPVAAAPFMLREMLEGQTLH